MVGTDVKCPNCSLKLFICCHNSACSDVYCSKSVNCELSSCSEGAATLDNTEISYDSLNTVADRLTHILL